MITLPIIEQAKQQEWKIILTTAQKKWIPEHIIHNLKKKLIFKKERHKPPTTQQNKKWVTFTYQSVNMESHQPLQTNQPKYSFPNHKHNTPTTNQQSNQHESQ